MPMNGEAPTTNWNSADYDDPAPRKDYRSRVEEYLRDAKDAYEEAHGRQLEAHKEVEETTAATVRARATWRRAEGVLRDLASVESFIRTETF